MTQGADRAGSGSIAGNSSGSKNDAMRLGGTAAVILAAGQGTRMKSALPKVMHAIAGRPLIHYPVRAAFEAGCSEVVVVVGHGREHVTAYLERAFGGRVKTAVGGWRGTGDAASAGMARAQRRSDVGPGVLRGVSPHGRGRPYGRAAERRPSPRCWPPAVAEPFGYGRIVRDASVPS